MLEVFDEISFRSTSSAAVALAISVVILAVFAVTLVSKAVMLAVLESILLVFVVMLAVLALTLFVKTNSAA